MALFTAKSAGYTGMRDYSIILNSFQPQKNPFASKTGTLALLQPKLAKWRFLPQNRRDIPVREGI